MKLYSQLSIVLFIFLGCLNISAQGEEGQLKGSLFDQEHVSIPFATVAIIKLPDSTVVTGTTTDLDGIFELDAPVKGDYLLRFSAMGYESRFTDAFKITSPGYQRDFGQVILPAEVTMLNEVMVQAWRPRVELEAGKMVVRVEGTAMAAGSTAYEVVSKSPGITADQDGGLNLNGKSGVEVMINGRETFLSADELKNFLETMPAENIEKIELVHSPSAKYPAAGTSGIINIILKQNVKTGFSGSVYGGVEFNDENWYNAGVNLNYGQEKWSGFVNLDATKSGFNRELEAFREFTNEGEFDYYAQTGKQLETRWVPSIRTGFDYLIDKKHTIGITGSYSFYEEDGSWNTETALGDYAEGDLVNIIAKNSSVEDYGNGRLNAHYVGKLDTIGTLLTADVDYVRLNRDRDSYFDNFYTYFQDETNETEHLFNQSFSSYDIIAAKADLELPLTERSGLAIGVKGSKITSESDLKFYLGKAGERTLDPTRSNNFNYEEEIYAAYLSYRNKFNDTWNLQAGLRAEQTIGEGISPTTGDVNKRDYLDFFPNIQLSQKVTENYELNYSYNRRIDRPRYSTLNPFLFYLDPYTYIVGNPDLEASITSSYKVTQNLFGKYQLILGYDHTEGPMGEYPRINEETGQTIFTTANLEKETSIFATLVVPVEIGSFWNLTNTLVVNQMNHEIAYEDRLIENDNLYYSLQSNSQFNLPWDMNMEVIGAYNGPMALGIYQLESRWYIDLGLKKSFLYDRLDVTLKAKDIFNGMKMTVTGEYPGSTFKMQQHFYNQGVSVNLRYKLSRAGKEKDTRQKNLEELNRAGG